MYTLHLSVYRRTLVQEIGGWRSEFDGAQDHDLALRLTERTDRVAHSSRTLYNWRAHAGSAALDDLAKPYAYERGVKAVEEHLRRTGIDAAAEALPIAGRYRVVYSPRRGERAAVVVPLPPHLGEETDLADHLKIISAAVARNRAESVRLVVVATDRTADVASETLGDRATVLKVGEGTWGSLARAGAASADADVLVLLETLCAPQISDWLEDLTGPLRHPGVCASSPLVLDHEGRVVHAGLALVRGLPLPIHPMAETAGEAVPPELTMVTNRSATAGVVAITRAALARAEATVGRRDHLALAALTAELTRAGGRVVCTPHSPWELLSRPLATDLEAMRVFALELTGRDDPYYNPRLWPDRAAHIVPQALQQTALRGEARLL
jgi:hypothetical protein